MTRTPARRARNGIPVPLDEVPQLSVADFRAAVVESVGAGRRLSALVGVPQADGALRLFAVVAHDLDAALSLVATDVRGAYPALTPDCPQAHLFERELAESWGVRPEGHPWLKPVRFPGTGTVGVTEFFAVEGDEIHEVAVGPVHAGVIEPGHFRFQCHGEKVLHLEIALGYQHRGVERALVAGPPKRRLHLVETLAGDTTVGHATAYCQALEALAGATVPLRAQALRGIALELERLANHAGDLGALAGDVGYLPTASFCGRLRGDFLNLTALVCGSRFGRSLVVPGGVAFDVDPARAVDLAARLERALADLAGAVQLLWDTPSVMARFEGTGRVDREACDALGLVGVAARACGASRDARCDFPAGIYQFAQIPVSSWDTGDVFGRAFVRWLEVQKAAEFVGEQARALAEGALAAPLGALAPESIVVSLVEGWRGEICHVALTDGAGALAAYKVVDPSFHNWTGLALALRDQEISDFPLCNKSFNLSYCGHDL